MPRALLFAAIALLFGGSAWAQTRPASEAIGSWVLSCPDAKTLPCQLRHRASMQPAASGPSASLEVAYRGDQFVPVVTLRGMSMQAALGGVLAVQSDVALRFDNQAPITLGCGLDGGAIVCAPAGDAATAAAAELSAAHSVAGADAVQHAGGDDAAGTVALARSATDRGGAGGVSRHCARQ